MPILLRLADLGARHPGVTKALGDAYAEAAAVCLSRHHHESPVNVAAEYRKEGAECVLPWDAPTAAVARAHANEIDATEQGAYAVSFAAVEALAGLVAVRRAETLTGADYYVAPLGAADIDDMETCLRMEISGVNAGGESTVRARLRQKLLQTEKGRSNLPALAAVIGFREKLIAIAHMGED
ncbi:hypothetical protein [Janthinobacterium sp. RB2R34]|uniref:hypothetical protein n=1 Tax=Janthinobacterium sp. RB2R34 TaxID=3424193 RepID=UPI003F26E488